MTEQEAMDVRKKLVELLKQMGKREREEGGVTWYDVADHLIANGVTVQEWIPVCEPPKERGCYLISVTHWLDGKPVTREAKWNGTHWLSCYRKEDITPRVTHWMPLPEPQKGE